MARRYDPSIVRRHWQYDRKNLINLFKITDGTLTNWVTGGLQPVDDKRPQLFSGNEVRRYLTQRQFGARSEPKDGKLFCVHCCRYNPLQLDSIIPSPDALRGTHLRGCCTTCDNFIEAFVNSAQLADIYKVAASYARDSSAESGGSASRNTVGLTAHIFSETSKSNLRILYAFQLYLLEHQGLDPKTVDEYLRSLARMSVVTKHKSFIGYKVDDAITIKTALRAVSCDREEPLLKLTTVDRTLRHCESFFEWLLRQHQSYLPSDLSGYFSLTRQEKRIAALAAKGTEFSFEQALQILKTMPSRNNLEIRNKAIISLFIMTGIRVEALTTLRGSHVKTDIFWLFQQPPEVKTKGTKNIRTYCLPISVKAREALIEWSDVRRGLGFEDGDAFFLPDCYLTENAIGLGYRVSGSQIAKCWRSTDPVRKIIRSAADAAGFDDVQIGAHDFRKIIHPYFAKNTDMNVEQETALQLNFGHTPRETIRKNYTSMSDADRQECLNQLCRAALGRSDPVLVLAYEKGEMSLDDPDYDRAKALHKKAECRLLKICQ